jgi:hypothetical protein
MAAALTVVCNVDEPHYSTLLLTFLIVAMVNESASISEFVQVTKVLAATAWDFLQH